VLFDVVQTRSALRLAVHHPRPGRNIGEGRLPGVLLLVIDDDEKAAIVVAERFMLTACPHNQLDKKQLPTILLANRGPVRGFGEVDNVSMD
jgi:hypothetical protein